MKFFNFFTLFFLIMLMGCTQDPSTNVIVKTSNGLSVANFTTSLSTLRVNEMSNIQLLLRNDGFFDARDINSILYGEGLLVRDNEYNNSALILPDKQDILFWTLRVPLSLSRTESTSYTVSARIYYNYNFSGNKQIGFVPSTYSGGDLPLSSTTRQSPLSVLINVNNPIRTFNTVDFTTFTITPVVSRVDDGSIDYFNCNVYGDSPCNKGGYINSVKLTVPIDWIEVTDLSVWTKSEDAVNSERTYSIYYDDLLVLYNDNSCRSLSNSTYCNKVNQAINYLRMIRGDEARLVLQFGKSEVSEVIIDNIKFEGDFGFKVDVSDFKNRLNLLVLGD